ncbi:DsrE family protein [Marinitoga aeolica]|uniref:DsrE family protein n=2 Tax=Marinitoga aeolica TaxID=2809031 RepID=A0ABY8PU13_9BACT|nr:DsrE family protein [Marinitoga aeolica]
MKPGEILEVWIDYPMSKERIPEGMKKMGHEVIIFLFCDAAIASNNQIKPVRSDRKIPDLLKEVIDRGGKVEICGICMDYRGITTDMIVEGSNPSGLPELAALIYESDRFISLMA